ncbi:hypothetical protein N7517_001086 [Penicillium concentricum]|uniref:Transmembrane protein n=1 Tax=Penicillium concentricum TaxID=293559 RepID=A0A9W9SS83_9EURO|nr:uncharacterized protein N7517_001086 [Penicillium concentricum]KAJ5383175.1 hypothetical protein N7517_001086 [Penicillium concentricum]
MFRLSGGQTGNGNDPVPVQSSDHDTPNQKTPDTTTTTTTTYASPSRDGITPAAWGVGWRVPTMMVGLVFAGAMFSMGHHLYYQSLDSTRVNSVDQQTWAIRIGTGFAFLIKSFLVSAVGIAAVQVMWATLRRKFVKLRGIDGMFAVLSSPLALLTPDLWMCAKTLILLAIMSWLIPLTAIVTPATLTIDLLTTTNITQMRVPTVNFIDSFWHPWATNEGAGFIASPAAGINRLFTATYSSAEVVPFSAPFPNSSYTLKFWGPSYKCQRLSEAIVEMEGLTFTDHLGENYTSLQKVWDHEVGNLSDTFTTLYSGAVSTALNNTFFVYATGANPLWNDNATQPTELVCQLWNTSYVVDLKFTNGIRSLTPVSTKHVAPANWSSRSGSLTTLGPQGPTVNGGFYITHLLFSDIIQSTMIISAVGSLETILTSSMQSAQMTFTQISVMQTSLFGCPELWNSSDYKMMVPAVDQSTTLCRNKTLARAIEDLSHNFTYSLLSLNAANTSVPVTISSPQNFYAYDSKNLLAAYMTALGVTVVCVIVGFIALNQNGVAQSTSFSGMLLTTRNPELDHLAKGHCLGSDQLPDEIGDIQLRFGEVESSEHYKSAAFGTKESVTPLSKGKDYY